jgi:hypothetical protein
MIDKDDRKIPPLRPPYEMWDKKHGGARIYVESPLQPRPADDYIDPKKDLANKLKNVLTKKIT